MIASSLTTPRKVFGRRRELVAVRDHKLGSLVCKPSTQTRRLTRAKSEENQHWRGVALIWQTHPIGE